MTDTELDSILESGHNKRFPTDLPFWRLIILSSAEVKNEFVAPFIFHHALGDGSSGIVFHKDFSQLFWWLSSTAQ
jgi:hypothetical protein